MFTTTNRHGRANRSFGKRGPSAKNKRNFSSHTKRGSFGMERNRRRGNSRRNVQSFDPSRFINTNPIGKTVSVYEPKHTFGSFGLSHTLVQTISDLGMERPSPIQDQIIPHILEGKDVIGIAETGTGKTAAFLIPLVEKAIQDDKKQTLILTPTRELAIQIENEFRKLSRGNKLFAVTCVGGTSIRPQIRMLLKKNHFIIGTPGRVNDLIARNCIHMKDLSAIVLDEADRMLDMGFINDMRKILNKKTEECNVLLFSATMSDTAKKLVKDFMKNIVTISIKKTDVTESILQDVVSYKKEGKFETLVSLFKDPELKRVIVFGSMKHAVEDLAKRLNSLDIKAESIHGNKNHTQRQRSLKNFKSGNARVLVATDVASRGIHVDNVSHVINYDLPNTFEDYVHRIGRTGRADKTGKALTFIPARTS